MNGRIRTGIAVVAAVGLLALAGTAAGQTDQPPPGVTPQQYEAELARGEALNKRYHLGSYSPAAQAGPKPAGMTTQQWQAELARGDALNRLYGLGAYAEGRAASAAGAQEPARVVTVASDGFDWGSAGIGAGAAIGIGLLATGMVVGLRQTRRSQLTPTT
jgi:hypothetical protein